jgi:hypothetical protein
MQALTAAKPLVAPAGRFTVHLSIPGPDAYRVEVRTADLAGHLVDELTGSHPSESLARGIARVLTLALRKSDATIESARAAVVAFLDNQLVFLLDKPGIAGRVEKADLLMRARAGFAVDGEFVAVTA